jgi:lipopolysaccharide export system protein LptA
VIQFDEKNQVALIFGEEDVSFNQEDLSGTSERVKWLFNENTMLLQGSPSVTKRGGGTTVGKELKIDLKTNNITILSSATERSETIIK